MNRKSFAIALVLGVLLGAVGYGVISKIASKRKIEASYENWRKLNLILDAVDRNYVDTIDKVVVTDAALEAALKKLDPHSLYMKPEPLKQADEDLAGGFEGIGIQFNVPNDTAIVLTAIPGGPSEKAGIMTGDRIIKVNDKIIAGNKTPQDTMVRRMKGPKGTKVIITIDRAGEKIPFTIIRDKIPEKCVDAAFMLNDTTAYMRLSKFTRTTYTECFSAARQLQKMGMRKLIFDLRSNTGGYFDQACLLANEFLPKGAQIVYMQGLHRKREDVNADGNGSFQNLALEVLIDDASASASEIFAGAIQDNDRGVIVGRRSFGKGLVQEPIYLSDGSGVRLTVARFYTPSGRCIQKPYSDDYAYDFYYRYAHGELTSADSIKVDSSKVFKTKAGRTVYGGGGIIPDVFVPLDTTKSTKFYQECNKKAIPVRFASKFFDRHRASLSPIADFAQLQNYMNSLPVEQEFIDYAAGLGVKLSSRKEWNETESYLMPQILGLCARYSKVGEEAFYRYVIDTDDVLTAAVSHSASLELE